MAAPRNHALRGRSYSEWRLDIDYWDKLSPEETDYLAEFLDDYYHADTKTPSLDIVSLTAAQSQDLEAPRQRSHYTPEDYKEDPCPRSASTPKTRLLG